jgi:hypothetical protein
MPKTRGATAALAAIIFSSTSIIYLSSSEAGAIDDTRGAPFDPARTSLAPPYRLENDQFAGAAPSRRAPVGHRQPRADDIPASQLPPIEIEMRREDEMIDKKLIICRGC